MTGVVVSTGAAVSAGDMVSSVACRSLVLPEQATPAMGMSSRLIITMNWLNILIPCIKCWGKSSKKVPSVQHKN